jgi:hypothetical protein
LPFTACNTPSEFEPAFQDVGHFPKWPEFCGPGFGARPAHQGRVGHEVQPGALTVLAKEHRPAVRLAPLEEADLIQRRRDFTGATEPPSHAELLARAIDSSAATSVRKNGGHGNRPAPEDSIRVCLKSALPRVRSLEPDPETLRFAPRLHRRRRSLSDNEHPATALTVYLWVFRMDQRFL